MKTLNKKSVRDSFVKTFSEQQASKLEVAAEAHKNSIHDKKGSDPFKWAVLIAIGYQCVEIDRYRDSHGITIPFSAFKKWCKKYGQLGSHDGDSDYLSLFVGKYNDYVK